MTSARSSQWNLIKLEDEFSYEGSPPVKDAFVMNAIGMPNTTTEESN